MDADACGRVGWLMRCLQTRMSINKKYIYIYLPDGGRGCVAMRANADGGQMRPVKKNKTKRRKEKKTYLILDVDGSGCGW